MWYLGHCRETPDLLTSFSLPFRLSVFDYLDEERSELNWTKMHQKLLSEGEKFSAAKFVPNFYQKIVPIFFLLEIIWSVEKTIFSRVTKLEGRGLWGGKVKIAIDSFRLRQLGQARRRIKLGELVKVGHLIIDQVKQLYQVSWLEK